MAVTLYGDRNFADAFKDLNMRRVSWIIERAQFKHLRCTANTSWVIKGGDSFLVSQRDATNEDVTNGQRDANLLL